MTSQKILLLALGSRTNLFYLRLINDFFQSNKDSDSVFSVVVKKLDFDNINKFLPDRFTELEAIMSEQLTKTSEYDKVIIPNITLHETVDRIHEKTNVNYPVVHPIQLLVPQLIADNCTQIKLVSSKYGMDSDYLKSYFFRNNIDVIIPTQDEQIIIDDFRNKVYGFCETSDDVNQYLSLLSDYQQDSDVVIACTELSLMAPSYANNLYDMSRVQIDYALSIN